MDVYSHSRQWLLWLSSVILLAFPEASLRAQQSDISGVWKNVDGREMTATLLQATDGEAEFMLRNGKRARIELEKLIPSDRERVQRFRKSGRYWTTPPKHSQWPQRVTLNWLQTDVEVVEEGKFGKFVYRTPHYEFEADAKLAPNLVKDFCKIFEVTHAAMEQNPLGMRLKEPKGGYFKVRLFKDNRGYVRGGGMLGAAGVYNRNTKQILVPFHSIGLRKANVAWVRKGNVYDPTTLIHEATHQLLDQWLEVMPIWFSEGFADLVGSSHYDSGQLFFDRLEDGIKERIRGRENQNMRIRDRGPAGFEFPLDAHGVLHASQYHFMGFPPAPKLKHHVILHNYHSSLLLVHFALNEDNQAGVQRLRRYLEFYRQTVTKGGVSELEYPERVKTDEEIEEAKEITKKLISIQREGVDKAYPTIAHGRSEDEFFADMTNYYKSLGILLKPEE